MVKLYKRATYFYAMPLVLLLFAMVSSEEEIVLIVFLLSLFPFSVVGLIYTMKGLRLASHSNDYEKKDVGFANLTLGLILFVFGLLALGFVYIRT